MLAHRTGATEVESFVAPSTQMQHYDRHLSFMCKFTKITCIDFILHTNKHTEIIASEK